MRHRALRLAQDVQEACCNGSGVIEPLDLTLKDRREAVFPFAPRGSLCASTGFTDVSRARAA
jgi:hypothetical protein